MIRALIALVASFVVLVVIAWTMQRRLIYFPMGGSPGSPGDPAVEEITLVTSDGVSLAAWFLRSQSPPAPTVLVFNGNAGNRAHRLPFAQRLNRAGASVLLFDYRGFGGNLGSPSHSGLTADALAARAYLARRRDIDHARVVYFGESLGAAVAAELAVTQPPAALILRSPFTSLAEVGRHHYPFLPVRWLLRDNYDVLASVRRVPVPTLVIAGDRDVVVPVEYSRRVFDAAAGPKELVIVNGADHNDEALFAGEVMRRAIERLLRTVG